MNYYSHTIQTAYGVLGLKIWTLFLWNEYPILYLRMGRIQNSLFRSSSIKMKKILYIRLN